MKYRRMGNSGLVISEIALGSWLTALKSSVERNTATEVVRAAYEAGVNFFDCADVYSGGAAERFLGEILKDYPRSSYVVSSKVYFPVGKGPNERGLSRKHIRESIDRSLLNMKLDYVDIYYCHRFDEQGNLTEALRTLSSLVDEGKILYIGVSSGWSSARLEEAEKIIERYGLHPISVHQPRYSMMDRHIEKDLIATCKKYGIGITPYSPLAQGLLTGKYKAGQSWPEDSRAKTDPEGFILDSLNEKNFATVGRLEKIADELGCSLATLALAWILRLPEITAPIIGASKVSQLTDNLSALDLKLSPDVLLAIDEALGEE